MGIYNPRNTIIVTCRDGSDDAVTLSWHSPASFSPFLYAIFLAKKRKSLELIMSSKEFCVNFLSEDQEELALFCGTKSGHTVNKFKEMPIEKEDCDEIDCVRIKNCSSYLECKAIDFVEVGDHIMVIGKVLKEIEGNNKKKLFQSNIRGPFSFSTTKD